jgi:hypothetical protein
MWTDLKTLSVTRVGSLPHRVGESFCRRGTENTEVFYPQMNANKREIFKTNHPQMNMDEHGYLEYLTSLSSVFIADIYPVPLQYRAAQ